MLFFINTYTIVMYLLDGVCILHLNFVKQTEILFMKTCKQQQFSICPII